MTGGGSEYMCAMAWVRRVKTTVVTDSLLPPNSGLKAWWQGPLIHLLSHFTGPVIFFDKSLEIIHTLILRLKEHF